MSFFFLHAKTGQSWAVDDPVAWAQANAQEPILERARDGLLALAAPDRERIIRLVVRRLAFPRVRLVDDGEDWLTILSSGDGTSLR